MLVLKVAEEAALYYVHAYARFGDLETAGVFYADQNFALEQVILMLVFGYGLFNTIRDTLTPKKIGIILIAFFTSFLIFHVVVLAVLNRGYSDFYKTFVVEGSGVMYYFQMILENLVIPAVLGIAGIVSSYFYFIRDGKRSIWRIMVILVSIAGVVIKAITVASKMSNLKFETINSSTASIVDTRLLASENVSEIIFALAVYGLAVYQVYALYRKRKLANELSNE
jgi:hypothetical protein